jgi:hypothetical protein
MCDENWHQQRFKIFMNYTLPSVQGQSSKKFKWIIFFNEKLASVYMDKITEIVQQMPGVIFIYVKPEQNHIELLYQYVNEFVSTRYLLTTRLDNDDVISIDLINKVQQIFHLNLETTNDEEYIINAGNGFQKELIFPFRKSIIQNYQYSPFISLISKRTDSYGYRTVLDKPHHKWNNLLTTLETDMIGWTQLIHEHNLANHISTLHLVSNIPKAEFPFLSEESLLKSLFNSFFLPLQIVFSAASIIWKKAKSKL